MKSKLGNRRSLLNIDNEATILHRFKNMLTKEEYEISSRLVKKFRLNLTSRATPEDFELFIEYLVTFRDYILKCNKSGVAINRSIKDLNLHISSIYSRLTRKHPKQFEHWNNHFEFCYKNKLLRDLRKSINLGLSKCGDNYKMYIAKIRFEYNVKEDVQEGRKYFIKSAGLHKNKLNEMIEKTIECEIEYYKRKELKDTSFFDYARALVEQINKEDLKTKLTNKLIY